MLVSLFLQVILLSATMPQDVLEVTTRFMRDPVRILVKKEELTLEGIRQFYIEVEREVWCTFTRHTVRRVAVCSLLLVNSENPLKNAQGIFCDAKYVK